MGGTGRHHCRTCGAQVCEMCGTDRCPNPKCPWWDETGELRETLPAGQTCPTCNKGNGILEWRCDNNADPNSDHFPGSWAWHACNPTFGGIWYVPLPGTSKQRDQIRQAFVNMKQPDLSCYNLNDSNI